MSEQEPKAPPAPAAQSAQTAASPVPLRQAAPARDPDLRRGLLPDTINLKGGGEPSQR